MNASEQINVACPHCGGHLEFSANDLGLETSCPHCNSEITLSNHPPKPPPPPPAPKLVETPPPPKPKKIRYLLKVVFLFIFGFIFIVSGFGSELTAKSSIHQCYGALQYCTGFVLMGLALIIETLGQIGNRNS